VKVTQELYENLQELTVLSRIILRSKNTNIHPELMDCMQSGFDESIKDLVKLVKEAADE